MKFADFEFRILPRPGSLLTGPVCGVDEHPHAVDRDEGYEGQTEAAKHQTRVLDGHGKGQDAHTDVALKKMDHRLEITGRRKLCIRISTNAPYVTEDFYDMAFLSSILTSSGVISGCSSSLLPSPGP